MTAVLPLTRRQATVNSPTGASNVPRGFSPEGPLWASSVNSMPAAVNVPVTESSPGLCAAATPEKQPPAVATRVPSSSPKRDAVRVPDRMGSPPSRHRRDRLRFGRRPADGCATGPDKRPVVAGGDRVLRRYSCSGDQRRNPKASPQVRRPTSQGTTQPGRRSGSCSRCSGDAPSAIIPEARALGIDTVRLSDDVSVPGVRPSFEAFRTARMPLLFTANHRQVRNAQGHRSAHPPVGPYELATYRQELGAVLDELEPAYLQVANEEVE